MDTFEAATAQLREARDAAVLAQLGATATRFRQRAEARGLLQLARLAGFAERLTGAAPKLNAAEFGTLLSFFAQLAACLRGALGRVAVGDGEGALGLELAQLGGTGLLLSLLKQNPGAFAARTDAAKALPAATPTASSTTPHALTGLLHTFYREHREDWRFFAPEIREQVTLIRALLEKLRAAPPAEHAQFRQSLFRALHTVKGTAYMVGLGPLGNVAHRLEDLLAGADEVASSDEVLDGLEIGAEVLEGLLAAAEGQRAPLPELLARLEASFTAATRPGLEQADPTSTLAESATSDAEKLDAERLDAEKLDAEKEAVTAALTSPFSPAEGSLQVSRARIASWTELTDELAQLRARLEGELEQLAELGPLLSAARRQLDRLGALPASPEDAASQLEEVADDLGELGAQLGSLLGRSYGSLNALGRTTRTLRGEVNRVRRVRIGALFDRFAGFLEGRDEVRLETVGAETEVDTQVLDELSEPLLHLVRNALAHAAEPAAVRLAAGKKARLTLTLRAETEGQWLRLEVADDGPGVRVAALRRTAVTRGLRTAAEVAALSEQEALELMFVPGLSTAPNVDVTAGRGVGMDAVAASVARLAGTLEVDTEPGQGTRFQLRVPPTRRVSDALFVGAGAHTFALPLGAVRLLTVVSQAALADAQLSAEGEAIPLFELTRLLGLTPGVRPGKLTGDSAEINLPGSGLRALNLAAALPTVVLSTAEARFALVVESLGATAEVVLKGGGELLAGLDYLSGITVSGTGVATPLLEPGGLLRLAQGGFTGERITLTDAPAPLRILLADDSLSVRRILGRSLAREGCEVVTAADGQAALETLLSGGVFDALLTDLEMPRLGGFGLIERLRSYPPTAALPICVMTTRAGAAHAEHAATLGADAYLTKPVTAAQLQDFLLPLRARKT